jgi:hypothetical protein
MARLPSVSRSYAHAKANMKSAAASAGSSRYTPTRRELFGPMMAQDIFNVNDYDDEDMVEEAVEDYIPESFESDELWLQGSLDLENVTQLEDRLRRSITHFERGYRKMMVSALKWHYLMEECDEDEQINKMFKDVQMIRKLRGSDKV